MPDKLINREKYLLLTVFLAVSLFTILQAGEFFLSLVLFLGAGGYLYFFTGMRPGEFEIAFPRRLYVFIGALFFLAVSFILVVGFGNEAYFWLILQFYLFSCLIFINYREVMILYLAGGFAGVTAGLTANPFVYISCGLLLFVSLYMLGSLARLGWDLSSPPEASEFRRLQKYILLQGTLIFIPLGMMNVLRRGISTDFTPLQSYFEPLGADPVEPVLPRFLTIIIVLIGGLVMMGLLAWLIKKLSDRKEGEAVNDTVMPREAEVDKKQKSTARDALKPVIKGGLSGKVIESIHSFLNWSDRQGYGRREGETVTDYFGRLVEKLALDMDIQFMAKIYNKARYAGGHPAQSAVGRIENKLKDIKEELEKDED
ncbi:MAG: hypothetical protein ACQEP7_06960 [bacterium]